jgi:hypothetical protein
MKGTGLCAAVAAILFVCAVAEGADWISFGESNIGTAYYDRADISHLSGDVLRVSVKYSYSAEGVNEFRKVFAGVRESQTVSYSLYAYDLDCSAGSFRLIRAATYNAAHVAIKGTELDLERSRQTAYEHVTPNSMMERLFNAACGWKLNAY